MFCFNTIGETLDHFIILPNCKSLPPELKHFNGQADFATGPNGWMTSKLFLEWAIILCRNVRLYRLRLSNEKKNKPCFLFLDGHRSRLNSEACELFYQNNIRVIVFPAHTSHCTHLSRVILNTYLILFLRTSLMIILKIINRESLLQHKNDLK